MTRTKLYSAMVIIFTIALLSIPSLRSASAAPDIRQYGPFKSSSPDSGTCGNNWATDTFNRVFRVSLTPNADGTFNVTQQYRAGKFVTIEGPSPGACDPDETPNTVAADIRGKFTGTITYRVAGDYDPDANPGPGTTTASFFEEVFGADAVVTTTAFYFEYSTPHNGSWINSSDGNSGDITGTP